MTRGVRVGPRDLARFGIDELLFAEGRWFALVIDRQGGADVRAVKLLRGIDAPQMPRPFAVLGILTRGDVDFVVVDHRQR